MVVLPRTPLNRMPYLDLRAQTEEVVEAKSLLAFQIQGKINRLVHPQTSKPPGHLLITSGRS